jgi:STELLO glycosyltransferases
MTFRIDKVSKKNARYASLLTFLGAFSIVLLLGPQRPNDELRKPLIESKTYDEINKIDEPAANTGTIFSGKVVRTFANATRLQDGAIVASFMSPLPLHPESKLCEKWGVVTTINPPTDSILTFSALKDWCLVIVADTRTPTEGYLQLASDNGDGRIVFLSVQDQEDMGHYSPFVKRIPFKSFARKNIGYLFAIRHGAHAIFDFDDDNVLKEAAFSSSPHTPLVLLRDGDKNIRDDNTWIVRTVKPHKNDFAVPPSFNPLPYMNPSAVDIWPRGFPLQDVVLFSSFKTETALESIPFSRIAIVQSTCDHDPDVDAIYRLTRPLPVTFDDAPATATRLLVPPGRYSPYNAQATTHMYNAFWGLLLPYTVVGRVTDIWRSYFTQRILQDLGLVVIYSPPLVVHNRSTHDYTADLQAEQDLYMKTKALLDFLSSWSDTSMKLPGRMENLAIALYERDYIGLEDVLAMQEWLLALMDAGYKFPSLSGVQELSTVMRDMPLLREQAFLVPPMYNLGGKEGEWKTYRDFLAPKGWAGTVEDWNEWLEGSRIFQEQNRALVPSGIVLSLVIMAKDEWPILRMNIIYHGHLFGFENLYILDGSTDSRCTSFLVYARDQLGANVIFTPGDLNELDGEMSFIGRHLEASSDLIIKIDVDEFVAVDLNDGTSCQNSLLGRSPRNCAISPLRVKTFLQNRTNLELFFAGIGRLQVGSLWGSLPDKQLCTAGRGDDVTSYMFIKHNHEGFKAIFDARTFASIDLGGHVGARFGVYATSPAVFSTPIGVMHLHARCFHHEVENCRKACLSHGFIAESDSPNEVTEKLKVYMGEGGCTVDTVEKMKAMAPSVHKIFFYARYLQGCDGATEETFYPSIPQDIAASNPDLIASMDKALSYYG